MAAARVGVVGPLGPFRLPVSPPTSRPRRPHQLSLPLACRALCSPVQWVSTIPKRNKTHENRQNGTDAPAERGGRDICRAMADDELAVGHQPDDGGDSRA